MGFEKDIEKKNELLLNTSSKTKSNSKMSKVDSGKPKRNRKVAVIDKSDHWYLVRWENFPDSEDTWELRSRIPADLIRTFEEGNNTIHDNMPEKTKCVRQDNGSLSIKILK